MGYVAKTGDMSTMEWMMNGNMNYLVRVLASENISEVFAREMLTKVEDMLGQYRDLGESTKNMEVLRKAANLSKHIGELELRMRNQFGTEDLEDILTKCGDEVIGVDEIKISIIAETQEVEETVYEMKKVVKEVFETLVDPENIVEEIDNYGKEHKEFFLNADISNTAEHQETVEETFEGGKDTTMFRVELRSIMTVEDALWNQEDDDGGHSKIVGEVVENIVYEVNSSKDRNKEEYTQKIEVLSEIKQFFSSVDMVVVERQGIYYKENPPEMRDDVHIIYREAKQVNLVDKYIFLNMMKVSKLIIGNKRTIRWEEVEPGNWVRMIINIYIEDGMLTKQFYCSWEDLEPGNCVRQVAINWTVKLELFSLGEIIVKDTRDYSEEALDPGGGAHALFLEEIVGGEVGQCWVGILF